METLRGNIKWSLEAHQPLKILIVGAGITGLTTALALSLTGHQVTIYEAAHTLAEIGAGLQIAPNASRILARLGILEEVMNKANVLEGLSLRRWQDEVEIGTAPLMPEVGEKYGAPLCVIHRADLQNILLQSITSLPVPVQIHLDSKVISLDPDFGARIQLQSGEWVEGDVVICADGVKSSLRQYFLAPRSESNVEQGQEKERNKLQPTPTGDAAYRILIPRSKVEGDANALQLLENSVGMRWMGPGGHVMAYPIRDNTLYNMVLLHPQKPQIYHETGLIENCWTCKGSKTDLLSFYSSWNPTINNLLHYVEDGEVIEWNLYSHPPLPTWTKGQCVLIGDAAHPMLPYVAQGAAQGIEDAGVLACCLSLFEFTSGERRGVGIEDRLKIFERVRKERAERVQNSASETRRVLHLPDGEEQRARDARMRGVGKGQRLVDGEKGRNPDLWADRQWQEFMWGVDVMKVVIESWEDLVRSTLLR